MALLVAPVVLAPFVMAEDNLYLDTDKIELKDPLVRVTRPAKEWSFIDLAVLKKRELEKAGSGKGRVEDAFEKLKVQMQYSAANANFIIYAWKDEHQDVSVEKLGGDALTETQSFFKDKGKTTQNGKTKLGKLDAWGFEVSGKLVANDDEIVATKVLVYRPDDKEVFLLTLEVPKKNAESVSKFKKKLFSADTVKLQ
jgi:hypothetical protein